MSRRNDSSQVAALLHNEDPEDQPEHGRKQNTTNGPDRDEVSSPRPETSSGSSSHCETCQYSGPSSSSRPSCPRSSSPSASSSGPSCGQAEGGEHVERQRMDRSSSCCSLEELKRLPDCHNRLEPLTFSQTHSVFVDVNAFIRHGELVAQSGRDVWHSSFVKMPCSPSSIMNIKTFFSPNQVARWEIITKQLSRLSKKSTVSVNEVEEAILKYNPKYKDEWSFDALAVLIRRVPETDNYFSTLFPKIAALALELPKLVKKAIPMLQKGQTASITLSQVQISCLLANAFFCTFPHRNTNSPKAEYHNYPSINFTSLFGGWSELKSQKLRAIMHYFRVVTDPENKPQGLVTFERHVLHDSEIPNWRRCKEKMPKLHVTSRGSIENEGKGMLQVDFASKWIGGGVLGSGLVQEEILFLMNPELIVSRLFTEKLKDNECLIVTGSQQFSRYSGYADTFEWAGPYDDHTPRDEWKRRQRQILAIDAQFYKYSREQYTRSEVRRELNKAYCGFKSFGPNKPDIATGKWGCGAFHGDPHLKAVIQLMAAAKAKRGLAFFTFSDERLKEELQQLYHLLVTEGTTVETLFDLVENFCEVHQASGGFPPLDLFGFIRTNLRPSRSQL